MLWYIFDLARERDGKIRLERVAKDKFIEENYIPEQGFFSYDHSEKIQADEIAGLVTQSYATDGKWDLHDFSNFYNNITDLYAFFLSLKKYAAPDTSIDLKKKIRESFREPPLRGGFSYVNMYEGLSSVQKSGERLSVGKLSYASAGEIDIRGRGEVFGEMSIALEELTSRYDDIKSKYNTLYRYCTKNKLLKAERESEVSAPVAKFLLEQSMEFAAMMHLEQADVIYNLTGRNSLIFAKILLSHFRRLERYFLFFAEGRVKEPKTVVSPPSG
jgi:hypothetical protein